MVRRPPDTNRTYTPLSYKTSFRSDRDLVGEKRQRKDAQARAGSDDIDIRTAVTAVEFRYFAHQHAPICKKSQSPVGQAVTSICAVLMPDNKKCNRRCLAAYWRCGGGRQPACASLVGAGRRDGRPRGAWFLAGPRRSAS